MVSAFVEKEALQPRNKPNREKKKSLLDSSDNKTPKSAKRWLANKLKWHWPEEQHRSPLLFQA